MIGTFLVLKLYKLEFYMVLEHSKLEFVESATVAPSVMEFGIKKMPARSMIQTHTRV